MFPESGGFRSEIVAIHVHGEALPQDQLDRLDGFMTPASEAQIERWIAELSVITARRNDDDMSEALRLKAYASRLAHYPADIVKDVLLRGPWKFFPTWVELRDALDRRVKTRKALIRAAHNPQPKPAPNRITYDPPPKERGLLPFVPDRVAPQPNIAHLREELALMEADKDLAASEYGKAYAQSLIARIAQAEACKPNRTTQEAV